MSDSCSFPAAILKGLIEHQDGTSYFGSLMGYAVYLKQAIDFGWVVASDERGEFGQIVYKPTEVGLEHYDRTGLKLLPSTKHSRAYAWDWSVYQD